MSFNPAEREAEVRRALDRVTDPELDEPVTELKFLEHLTVRSDGTWRLAPACQPIGALPISPS